MVFDLEIISLMNILIYVKIGFKVFFFYFIFVDSIMYDL